MRPARLQGASQPRPRHASLNEALERAAVAGRRGLTFVAADESETGLGWDAVRSRAAQVAGALNALGVRTGERVAMVLPTGPEFMDAFFGTLLAGAVPVPLYPPVRLGRLPEYHATTARMLRLSGAAAAAFRRPGGTAAGRGGPPGESAAGTAERREPARVEGESHRPSGGSRRTRPGPVLLGEHGGSEAGRALAPGGAGADRRAEGADAGRHARRSTARRELAPAVPRHGAHRLPPQRHDLSRSAGAARAGGIPRASGALASRGLPSPRDDVRGTELRLRGLCAAGEGRGDGRCGPLQLAPGAERGRADLGRGGPALLGSLLPLGVPPHGAHAGVRAGRGGACGDLLAAPRPAPDGAGRPGGARAGGSRPSGRRVLASVGVPVPGVSVEIRDESGAPPSPREWWGESTPAAPR